MATPIEKSRTIMIKTGFEGDQGGKTDAAAYLFDRSGALIASAPISKDVAKLTVEALPRGARLLIGPALDKTERAEPPSISALERLTAFEPKIRLRPDLDIYDIGKVPEFVWPLWPLCRCRVKGRVMVRRTSPGGVVVEAPVCNARVHICEVDRFPWLIERLPDPDIFRLRDDLIDIIRQPLQGPPEPVPWRELATLPRIPLASQVISNGRPETTLSRMDAVAFNPQPDPPSDPFRELPKAMQFSLQSHSASIIRRTLLDHIELVRPWICRWPWLHPWFYSCDELRVVTTDDQGRFDTTIWYPCAGDKPDLYFWVEYSIGGAWTPVHRPPIPCHVWWDYPCGTEVTITVTDPRVPGCGEKGGVKGRQLVVKTIGREVSMGEINREPSAINPLADPTKAGTIKPPSRSLREAPFGGVLEPRVDFGDKLTVAGITHYRWSYRRLGSAGAWIVIDAPINRHYQKNVVPPEYGYKPISSGSANDYYVEIDPTLPGDGVDWEILDEGYDLASAYWTTTPLDPPHPTSGKYELKLELFKNIGGVMQRVDLGAAGVGINEINDPAPLISGAYGTVPATDDRLLIEAGATVGYRLVIHVDNRPCFGTIDSVSVSPGANDTKCGFLQYGTDAMAKIVFRASHPGNYATFDFHVSRVATPLPKASANGLVDASGADANGFVRSIDQFSKDVSVFDLLNDELPSGETPCTRAAFGQSLRVSALATNGYRQLSELDAPNATPPGQIGLRAFAITPA
jgi:hypothetical protein